MGLRVEWAEEAKSEFRKLLMYLTSYWGERVAMQFYEVVEKSLSQIAVFPFMHPCIVENIRRCILSKQTSLYYRVDSDCVQVLTIWDNRRNPKDLEL